MSSCIVPRIAGRHTRTTRSRVFLLRQDYRKKWKNTETSGRTYALDGRSLRTDGRSGRTDALERGWTDALDARTDALDGRTLGTDAYLEHALGRVTIAPSDILDTYTIRILFYLIYCIWTYMNATMHNATVQSAISCIFSNCDEKENIEKRNIFSWACVRVFHFFVAFVYIFCLSFIGLHVWKFIFFMIWKEHYSINWI